MSSPPPGRFVIPILAAIAMMGSLATQLLVPALPTIAQDLKASTGDTQLIITVYLVGLAIGQLLVGPASDRIGRRPVLVAGTVAFGAASFAASLAPNLPLLLAARAVQALGAAAGVITTRVLIGDIFAGAEAAAKQATLMSVVLISPTVAPVIGGLVTEIAGWRVIFVILCAVGVFAALVALFLLPSPKRETAIGPRHGLIAAYGRLLRNPTVVTATCVIAAASSGLYMFMTTTPFLLAHDHGLSPREIGQCLLLVALASMAGTFTVRHLEPRGVALRIATALTAIGSFGLLGLTLMGFHSLVAYLAPTMLLCFSAGILSPAGITRVIRAAPGLEGTAASLTGATQMLTSAFAATLLGRFMPVSALQLSIGLAITATIAVAAATQLEGNVKPSM
jgi:DHA1 family bicyclomycin/chloramphenicol resistance-like MFS transporter